MLQNKQITEGPKIDITGSTGRFEIVKEIVNTFIEFEKDKKGKGIKFKYPVEDLSTGERLYISRPGVKWNFDFKVEISTELELEEGRHDQIALILRNIKSKDEKEFNKLWKAISDLYHCTNNDVDFILRRSPISYKEGPRADILLKVIKWLFIMEDIIYWHYEGRAFLYNFFNYVINEHNNERLRSILQEIREGKVKPEKIKDFLNKCNMEWKPP